MMRRVIRRQEAVVSIIVPEKSNNLSGIVDAEGERVNTPWRIDACVLPVVVNKGRPPGLQPTSLISLSNCVRN